MYNTEYKQPKLKPEELANDSTFSLHSIILMSASVHILHHFSKSLPVCHVEFINYISLKEWAKKKKTHKKQWFAASFTN